jgi:hypothetical protein
MLNKSLCKVKLVSAHYTLFILDNWDSLKLKREWKGAYSSILVKELSNLSLLLVDDEELIITWCQNNIDVDLSLAYLV